MSDKRQAERIECPYCETTVADTNGLWMHVRAKHPERRKDHQKLEAKDQSMKPCFEAMKAHDKERRQINYARADPKGWKIHCDTHWSQKFLGDRIDYWPTRNKFRWRGVTHHGDVVGFMKNRTEAFLSQHTP